MFSGHLHELDQAGSLAAVESMVRARRQVAVDELQLVLHWADLHSGDPQDQPGAVPVKQGGDRLISLGGEGTPQASEFCWAELAVARQAGVIATRSLAADGLDLRHRMPRLYAKVVALEVEVWVARKIAKMARGLSRDAAEMVDAALAAADDLAPGRLLALAEAKVIEADLEAHRRRVAEDATRTGVWISRRRPGDALGKEAGPAESATGRMAAQLSLAHLLGLDATVDEVADVLATQPDYAGLTRDQLRAEALGLLASPDRALALLQGAHDPQAPEPRPLPRRTATLVVHVSTAALAGVDAVARCDRLGPLLLEQAREVLGLRDVRLQPVIDLNAVQAVDAYEHPTRIKQRTLLRTGGDVFPHSTGTSARVDHDHVTPYDPLGPPGQTGDLNDAPLTRLHHRIKTHARGWQSKQLGLGAYRWVTPHGLCRVVAAPRSSNPSATTTAPSSARSTTRPPGSPSSSAEECVGLGQWSTPTVGRMSHAIEQGKATAHGKAAQCLGSSPHWLAALQVISGTISAASSACDHSPRTTKINT